MSDDSHRLTNGAVPFDRHADRKQQAELFRSAVGNLRILQVAARDTKKVSEGLPQNQTEGTIPRVGMEGERRWKKMGVGKTMKTTR